MRVFEVCKPAFEHWIQVAHDIRQAVATRAPCPTPDLFLQALQALLPDLTLPCFKPIAEEIESLPRLAAVANMRFIGMQRQAVLLDPRTYLFQGQHRIFPIAAQDDEIVGIAYPAVALA